MIINIAGDIQNHLNKSPYRNYHNHLKEEVVVAFADPPSAHGKPERNPKTISWTLKCHRRAKNTAQAMTS